MTGNGSSGVEVGISGFSNTSLGGSKLTRNGHFGTCTAEIGTPSTGIIEADETSPPRAAIPRTSSRTRVDTTSTGYITNSGELIIPNMFSSLRTTFSGETIAKISFSSNDQSAASTAEITIKTAPPIAAISHNNPKQNSANEDTARMHQPSRMKC